MIDIGAPHGRWSDGCGHGPRQHDWHRGPAVGWRTGQKQSNLFRWRYVLASETGRYIRVRDPRCILISGASSGIGAALARAYAAPATRLALCGRDAARLAAVTAFCRERGAAVSDARLDVT